LEENEKLFYGGIMNINWSSKTLRAMVVVALSLGTAMSWAQNASSPSAQPAMGPTPLSTSGDTNALEAIEVTGSRIVRNGYQTPTPVTVETASELAEAAPSNIADALNQLPEFVNSGSPEHSTFIVASHPLAGNFLNLRNLDPNRTLILLDGVRVPPSTADGSVNVDTLPQSLVERVDVVTGGASAVYGSDAVAGVVNFVLDKNFEGLKATGQGGISIHGDDSSEKFSLAGGHAFADGRVHVIGSFDYYNSDGIPDNNDRRNGDDASCLTGAGTAASPFHTVLNCRSNFTTSGGLIDGGPLNGYEFLPNGNVVPFNPGGLGGVGAGPYGFQANEPGTLIASLQTKQLFGRVGFDLTPAINVFAQASVGKASNGPNIAGVNNFTAYGSPNSIPIYIDNPYLNPSVLAALGNVPANVPAFTLSRWACDPCAAAIGKVDEAQEGSEQITYNDSILVGAEGKFGASWGWAVHYGYGSSKFNSNSYEVYYPNFFAAVNAIRGPNGNIVCRVTLTNPGEYPGCVPIDVFGVGAPSQAALNYTQGTSHWEVDNDLSMVDANVHGDAFSLWAGPVSVAGGVEYRNQSLSQTSNSNPASPIDTVGLGLPPSEAASLQHFNIINVGVASGSVNVKEVYGETVVPLAHDVQWADNFDLNIAGRETDYSTSGSVQSWKLGLNYNPIHDLRFRGSVSRDIRAPDLYDLYAGEQTSELIQLDPHTNTSSVAQTRSSGNSALQPEKGLTKTFGFIYQPDWLKGFGVSVDYYDIKITDAIITETPQENVAQCEASNGTAPACALIVRPFPFSNRTPANFPTIELTEPENASSVLVKGIDFELSYRFPVDQLIAGAPGNVELRGLANNTSTYDTVLAPGQPVEESAGYFLNPKWHGTLSAAYRTERLDVFLQERFTGSFLLPTYAGETIYADHGRGPSLVYTDLTITYKPFADIDLRPFLTVNNLFNIQPPLLVTFNTQGTAGQNFPTVKQAYDVIGAYFTLGVRYRF
jgi:iron complex outermembrane recepter protein